MVGGQVLPNGIGDSCHSLGVNVTWCELGLAKHSGTTRQTMVDWLSYLESGISQHLLSVVSINPLGPSLGAL